jgi:hypothetical protein
LRPCDDEELGLSVGIVFVERQKRADPPYGSSRCARAASGHVAAPSPAMNSRRRIRDLLMLLCREPIAIGAAWERANTGDCRYAAWLKGAGMTAFNESCRRSGHVFLSLIGPLQSAPGSWQRIGGESPSRGRSSQPPRRKTRWAVPMTQLARAACPLTATSFCRSSR